MAHESKRGKSIRDSGTRTRLYVVDEAIQLVKQTATAKFDESIDVSINLGIDAKKSDQNVRAHRAERRRFPFGAGHEGL